MPVCGEQQRSALFRLKSAGLVEMPGLGTKAKQIRLTDKGKELIAPDGPPPASILNRHAPRRPYSAPTITEVFALLRQRLADAHRQVSPCATALESTISRP